MTKYHSRFFNVFLALWIALLMGSGLRPAYAANVLPTVSITSPVSGALYGRFNSFILSAKAADSDGFIYKVEYYEGKLFLGQDGAGAQLTNVEVGTHVYTARAYDNNFASTLSAPITVTVLDSQAPGAAITGPSDGSTYAAPATITITATAFDQNGITKVEFYHGTNLLGTDTTFPYSLTLSDVATGTYYYSVKAYDTLGLSSVPYVGLSSVPYKVVRVNVVEPNTPPTISLTGPTDNSNYTAPAAITLDATASDNNGINRVEFYNGATLLGTATTSPYSLALSSVAVGTYAYSAIAYDSLNLSAASMTANVTVSAPNPPPTVSLTSPANNSSYTAPAAITLNATAADSSGITNVEFYRGTTLLGSDTTAPYSLALSGVAAGTYAYTAKATDTLNASTTSAVVNVSVKVSATAPAITALTATPQTLSDTATSQLSVTANDPDASPAPLSYVWSIVSGGGSLSSSTLRNPIYTPANVSTTTPVVIKAAVTDSITSVNQSITLTVNDTIVPSNTVVYYHNDALGSPIAATGPTGNLLWRESYRPYGERLDNQAAGATNPIWYTGKRQDPETGLVYMGARYYNPALGRFLSIDPVGPDENSLHSLNRYAYANNNPYRFTDPDGNIPLDTLWDAGNVIYDLGKAAYGAATNNPALVAQGLGDAAADTAAMLIPYVPAGSTKVARMAAEKAAEGVKNAKPGSAGFARTGKDFTPKTKVEIDADNAAKYGGVNKCEHCGVKVVPGQKSQRGVTPPLNERQRDHIKAKARGGDGTFPNGQILCRGCNLRKLDN